MNLHYLVDILFRSIVSTAPEPFWSVHSRLDQSMVKTNTFLRSTALLFLWIWLRYKAGLCDEFQVLRCDISLRNVPSIPNCGIKATIKKSWSRVFHDTIPAGHSRTCDALSHYFQFPSFQFLTIFTARDSRCGEYCSHFQVLHLQNDGVYTPVSIKSAAKPKACSNAIRQYAAHFVFVDLSKI